MSSAREAILGRLRTARGPAPTTPPPVPPADADTYADFPDSSVAAMRAAFSTKFTFLKGEFHAAPDAAAAARILRALVGETLSGPIWYQKTPLLESVLAKLPEWRERWRDVAHEGSHDPAGAGAIAGVSSAAALVARSGSLLIRADQQGGRRLTVLPPLHIVLATPDQLVPSLEQAMALLGPPGSGNWSYAGFITGPSRTGDIEKILVLGAHGPKRLALILIG